MSLRGNIIYYLFIMNLYFCGSPGNSFLLNIYYNIKGIWGERTVFNFFYSISCVPPPNSLILYNIYLKYEEEPE